MNTSHTPGPWKITHDTKSGQFVTETKIRDKTSGVIATMHINSENNARLIAAAPELLELVIEGARLANIFSTVEQTKRFEDGIAKATGQAIAIQPT
jgi:hypothetical protein